MSVTTKQLFDRTQRRTLLRVALNDNGAAATWIWSDAQLNTALNEALLFVQAHFPQRAVLVVTPTTDQRVFTLPDACGTVTSVSQVGTTDLTALPARIAGTWRVVTGYDATLRAAATNAWTKQLVLTVALPTDQKLLVEYMVTPLPWGDPTSTAADADVRDLAPEARSDGNETLLFDAVAQATTLRLATQAPAGSGGRDFDKEYASAMQRLQAVLDFLPHEVIDYRFSASIFGR